jgi:hypothetical protein
MSACANHAQIQQYQTRPVRAARLKGSLALEEALVWPIRCRAWNFNALFEEDYNSSPYL